MSPSLNAISEAKSLYSAQKLNLSDKTSIFVLSAALHSRSLPFISLILRYIVGNEHGCLDKDAL